MATKPAVLEEQRNRSLRGVPTSAPLPAMVDSDGRIVNASGFSGFSVHGGPLVRNSPVLSLPDANVTLTADQLVDAHLFTGRWSADRTITLPSAAAILKYLTSANARSAVHFDTDEVVNSGTVVAGAVPESATPIPFFETRINCIGPRIVQLVAVVGSGVAFKSDLSLAADSTNEQLEPPAATPTWYNLTWYILNAGAAPQIAIVIAK